MSVRQVSPPDLASSLPYEQALRESSTTGIYHSTLNFSFINSFPIFKVNVRPMYDACIRDCLLERTVVLGHRLCDVGWSVPFLATVILPVSPPGPHSLLGGP